MVWKQRQEGMRETQIVLKSQIIKAWDKPWVPVHNFPNDSQSQEKNTTKKVFLTSEKRQTQVYFSAKQDEPSHGVTFAGVSLQEDVYDDQIGLEAWTNLSFHFKR